MLDFSIRDKPSDWNTLPLYKKIKITMGKLTKDFAPFVDKLEAKKIVKGICGDAITIPKVIRQLNGPDDISEKDINSNIMIKGAHGCDFNINIKPNTKYDVQEIKKKLHSFNRPFNSVHEKQYSYLKPRFFIEEKVDDKIYGRTGDAVCYLLNCIHGVPYSFSIREKHTDRKRNFIFNKDKSLAPITELSNVKISNVKLSDIGEKNIQKMYDLASKLSKPFEFVRIDFYVGKNNEIYFSEYTFSCAAGQQRYPIDVETKLGKLWK